MYVFNVFENRKIYMHACMHTFMTKVISISDDVYESLKNLKKPEESFSIVIRELVNKRKNKKGLLSLAGSWKNNEEIIKIMKKVIEERKKFKVGN